MRTCYRCKRTIGDDESCWRDHLGRYFCNECDAIMRGKHDHIPSPEEGSVLSEAMILFCVTFTLVYLTLRMLT